MDTRATKSYRAHNAPPSVVELAGKLVPLLIEGEHQALASLRQQYGHTFIREITLSDVRFVVHYEVPVNTDVASPPDFAGGYASIKLRDAQRGAGCTLFVCGGHIATLVGFTYEGEWPEDADVVSIDDVMPIQPHAMLLEHATHGRIAEVSWTEYPRREGALWGAIILEGVVHRYEPTCLVVNLLGVNSVCGMPLISSLVAGAVAMRNLEGKRKFRILARGQMADRLDQYFRLVKVIDFLGGGIYPALEPALDQEVEG